MAPEAAEAEQRPFAARADGPARRRLDPRVSRAIAPVAESEALR